MVRAPGSWYAPGMVVRLEDLIADMLDAQERKERAKLAEEAGLSPEDIAVITAALGEPLPGQEPRD
jgi:hypothetical protein